MGHIQQLIDQMKLEDELWLMNRPHEIKREIKIISELYHVAIKNNRNEMADLANNIIDYLKKELEDVTRSNGDITCEVSKAQSTGNKTVFILQR